MKEHNPYSTPKTELIDSNVTGEASRYKKNIIINTESALPERCIKCNQPTEEFVNIKLFYMNPWWYLLILVNLLVLIIVSVFAGKRYRLKVPLCQLHNKKYKNRKLLVWGILLTSVITILIGLFLFSQQSETLGLVLTVGITLLLVAIITGFSIRLLHIRKRKGTTLWISGSKPAFLDSLPLYVEE